jgi:site-specific DNA recombinase
MRLLAPARISRKTDPSTSLDTQMVTVERFAHAYGHELIPVVPDLSVSGAVPIREREGIGPWLTDDRLDEWDGVITPKIDRLFRDQADFVLFYRDYCEAHGKVIISAGEGIDTSTEIGKFVATIMVMFAEMERGRMRVRRREAAARMREALRWNGGRVHFGYEAYQESDGWYLRPQIGDQATVNWWADQVIDHGRSGSSLTVEMNRRRVKTNYGKRWRDGTILAILRSPALRGFVMHYPPRVKGQPAPVPVPVLGADGMPLRREPIITDEKWFRLQAALDRNSTQKSGTRRHAAMLLRVAFCGLCERPYWNNGARRQGRASYACSGIREAVTGPGKRCHALTVPAQWLDALAVDLFLTQVGRVEITITVTVADDSQAAEMAAVGRQIADLTTERFVRGVIRDDYDQLLADLTRRHGELSAAKRRKPEVREISTGQTFAQRWEELAADTDARRQLMIKAGFRINVAKTAEGTTLTYALDPDLARRAGLAASGRA